MIVRDNVISRDLVAHFPPRFCSDSDTVSWRHLRGLGQLERTD